MDPSTLSAIGSGSSALGSFVSGIENVDMANYKKKLDQINYQQAIAMNTLNVQRSETQNRYQEGNDRAGVAASGLSLDGSALDILENNAVNRKMDTLLLNYQGLTKAYGYQLDANVQSANASNAQIGAILGAVGAGASGYSKYEAAAATNPATTALTTPSSSYLSGYAMPSSGNPYLTSPQGDPYMNDPNTGGYYGFGAHP